MSSPLRCISLLEHKLVLCFVLMFAILDVRLGRGGIFGLRLILPGTPGIEDNVAIELEWFVRCDGHLATNYSRSASLAKWLNAVAYVRPFRYQGARLILASNLLPKFVILGAIPGDWCMLPDSLKGVPLRCVPRKVVQSLKGV